MSGDTFTGFPAVSRATAIPNLFFGAVLPRLSAPGDLLAFLWVARVVQEQRGEARFVSAEQLWAEGGLAASFDALGGGRDGLEHGLAACAALGALVACGVAAPGGATTLYGLNNAASRRALARARAGELELKAGPVLPPGAEAPRPGIFRLYEEHVGTITPLVAEGLLRAAERYPPEWVEQAFREAAELNARNWRYIERILQRWDEEGRPGETPRRDSLADRKRRYLGGDLGHIVRYH